MLPLGLALLALAHASPVKRQSSWNLVTEYVSLITVNADIQSGSNFFDNWQFFTQSDPTGGCVTYVDQGTAQNDGLISINSAGHAIMSVDTTQTVSNARNSVRIQGNLIFTGGLVILDAYHMPTGCGTWPSFWSFGPNWPYSGEIDIVEGVHTATQNQASIHTGDGCTIPQNIDSQQTGTLNTATGSAAYNCYANQNGDSSCGVVDETSDPSFGAPFNNNGGGVYAMLWDTQTVEVFFWTRSAVPGDISSGNPDPSGWGTPVANFASNSCDPMTYFQNHFSVFDTTLCGAWAGAAGVWDGTSLGQSESCQQQTGYSSCTDYVLNNGNAFSEAYWEVASVRYYNSSSV